MANASYQETVTHSEEIPPEVTFYRKVTDPDIAVYLPSPSNAKLPAFIICPGGAYVSLAYKWEGTDAAEWLNERGIAGIVLKYRLPSDLIMEDKAVGPL